MKHVALALLMAVFTVATIGCSEPTSTANTDAPAVSAETKTALAADLCGKCGSHAESDECCKGETCACGMKKGTDLCCTGVEPKDTTYCKSCGFEKESEKCCSESNEACACGLAKGSPLCCKLKKDGAEGEDDHAHAEDK